MCYLPVFLDVALRRAVVLGAGETAERKAAALRRAVVRADLARGDAERIGSDPGPALLVRLGGEGKRVVRLFAGDPVASGGAAEAEAALAAAGIACEGVPGVARDWDGRGGNSLTG